MKSKIKSVNIKLCMLIISLLFLSACGDGGSLPHVFGGIEVPEDVQNKPRAVTNPAEKDLSDKPWPKLGIAVPSKPKNFSPKPVLDQAHREMEFDRSQAQAIQRQYENPQPSLATPFSEVTP